MPYCGFCHINYYYYDGQYCVDDSDFGSDSEGVCENCSYSGLSKKDLKDLEKVYCKGSDCYQKITRKEKYCSSCQTYCSFGSCLNKIPKTSNYCDKHVNPTCSCLSCNEKITSGKYCSYHENCLSKLRQYSSIDNIQELETFTT